MRWGEDKQRKGRTRDTVVFLPANKLASEQSKRNLAYTAPVPHTRAQAHTCTYIYTTYTHPVGPDDYHYPGKYIWPWVVGALSSFLSLVMWFFSLTFFMLHLLPITLLPHPVWGAHFAGIHGRARWRERWRCRDSPASSSNQLFRHDCVCIVLYQKALRKVSASGCVSVLWSLIHRHTRTHPYHTYYMHIH